MAYSKQRDLILSAVQENKIHPTADTVFSLLKPDHPELSLATVYRNLNRLAEKGLLLKIPVPNGADHFDGTLAPHYHMICEQCARMVDVPRAYVPEFDSQVAKKTGYAIRSHTIVFYGLCEHCNRTAHAAR